MGMSIHRKLVLLLLVTLLAAKPNMVCSVKRMDTIVHASKLDHQHTPFKSQDLKADAAAKEVKTTKDGSNPAHNVADPYQVSKRRVRRGADPIHNKA